MRKYPKTLILDTLHKGAVWACIGVTLGGTALLGYRFYNYFAVVRPEREAYELKVLEEGVPQFDAATLVDNAPNLKN